MGRRSQAEYLKLNVPEPEPAPERAPEHLPEHRRRINSPALAALMMAGLMTLALAMPPMPADLHRP